MSYFIRNRDTHETLISWFIFMSFCIIFSNTVLLSPTFGRGVEGTMSRVLCFLFFFFNFSFAFFKRVWSTSHAKVRSLWAILVIKKKIGDPALKVTDHGRGQLGHFQLELVPVLACFPVLIL